MPGATRLYGPTNSPAVPGMVPLNTSAAGGTPGALPCSVTVTGTAETVLPNPAFSSQPLMVQIPSYSPLEGQKFEVYASGMLNIGTSSAPTIKLYSGTSLTPASNTLLATSGAFTAFAGKTNWYMVASCEFDSASGKLNGTAKWFANNALVAEAAITAITSGISNKTNPVASFCLSVTFSIAGTQVITVQEFAVNF